MQEIPCTRPLAPSRSCLDCQATKSDVTVCVPVLLLGASNYSNILNYELRRYVCFGFLRLINFRNGEADDIW